MRGDAVPRWTSITGISHQPRLHSSQLSADGYPGKGESPCSGQLGEASPGLELRWWSPTWRPTLSLLLPGWGGLPTDTINFSSASAIQLRGAALLYIYRNIYKYTLSPCRVIYYFCETNPLYQQVWFILCSSCTCLLNTTFPRFFLKSAVFLSGG